MFSIDVVSATIKVSYAPSKEIVVKKAMMYFSVCDQTIYAPQISPERHKYLVPR